MESQVMGSSRAGGQSAQRFARERERQAHEFYEDVAETANANFVNGEEAVTGVAVGGTLSSARTFVSRDYLDHRLQDRLLGTFSVEYATVGGLHQLVEAASERLLDAERRAVREHLEEFFVRLRGDEPVAYGEGDVERAIEFGAVDVALVTSEVSPERREAIEEAVTNQGGEVCMVSTEIERGARFAAAFGGVGALLRFPVN